MALAMALLLLLALVANTAAQKLVFPCYWSATYELKGASFLHYTCADVPDASILAFDAGTEDGSFTEFSLAVYDDAGYNLFTSGSAAQCLNKACARVDAYEKVGSLVVPAGAGRVHVVVARPTVGKSANFAVMVSVSKHAPIIGGQLTGAPPPPPANVCQAIEEALPPFCVVHPDCASFDCDVDVLGIDTFDLAVELDFCGSPINMSLTVSDADHTFSDSFNISIGNYQIPIPDASFDIPFVGNATLNVVINLSGTRSNVSIAIGVEACTQTFGCFPSPPIEIIDAVLDFEDLPCPPGTW